MKFPEHWVKFKDWFLDNLQIGTSRETHELEEVEEKVEVIKAYNPRTGIPFREGEVVTKREVKNSFMLSFEHGAIEALTVDNFLKWIEGDAKLTKTVERIEDNAEEKLFKCLLIYDDRNPVFVPIRD